MLAQLRRRLTALAAVLTGSVVVAVIAAAFCISSKLYTLQQQTAFEAAVGDLWTQWEHDGVLDWDRIQRTARLDGIRLYLEENGTPLLFSVLQDSATQPTAVKGLLPGRGFDPAVPPLSGQVESCLVPNGSLDGQTVRVLARKQSTGHGWRLLLAWQSLAAERQTLLRTALLFGGVAAVGIAILTLLCWTVAGRAIRPVRDAMREQEEFVRAAGHELRTPLAVLRAGLAVLPGESSAEAVRHLQLLDAEALRMSGLIEQLLLLSGGSASASRPVQRVEPDTLTLDLAETWEAAARRSGCHLECHLPETPLPVLEICKEDVWQILSVFLDNALRYAPKGTAVEIGCLQQGRTVIFSVADHGPGIADQDKAQVFRRFWRADTSRTDRTHYGLGLSVAAELARRSGARVETADTPGGGATMRLVMPI